MTPGPLLGSMNGLYLRPPVEQALSHPVNPPPAFPRWKIDAPRVDRPLRVDRGPATGGTPRATSSSGPSPKLSTTRPRSAGSIAAGDE
ncbi:MAG TPA: hypothetical protein VGG32_02815 [Thermoplasmata archaeon]